MTMQTDLRSILADHLAATGLSCAALSRRAGIGEGIVAKIFRVPGYVPSAPILAALAEALGAELPDPFARAACTWAQIRETLRAADPRDRRISRINWLMRSAAWVAETRIADRREVIEVFASNEASTFDLAPSSFASYKSEILSCLPEPAGRARGIRDVTGPLRTLYDAIGEDENLRDYHLSSGGFLAWMDARGLAPRDLAPETLELYHRDRLATGDKSEKATRNHVQRIAALTRRLAGDPAYAGYGFPALPSPWARPEVLPGAGEIAPLLAEFDDKVSPWLRGEQSATGETREAFLARLDAATSAARPADPKAAALARARARAPSDGQAEDRAAKVMSGAGFLLRREQWSEGTIKSYRKQLHAMVRRLVVAEGIVIGSISDLVDPGNIELMLLLTLEANPDDEGFGSDYASSFALRAQKLAAGYVGVAGEQLEDLKALRARFDTKRTTVAPRNQARLEMFTEERAVRFCGLSAHLLRGIKLDVADRRRKAKAKGEPSGLADLYDSALACRVMQVIAHDLMLARAPRSANVLEARLDWIRWRGGCASLVVPAARVKMRTGQDPDLIVPLGEEASETLRVYLEVIRAKALREGDEANPHLFPSPKVPGRPYMNLLNKLCDRVHKHVGAEITPHLYRHLMGWIWLRRDPSALPQVQRLLGHKSLVTTMKYYAAIADEVALNLWQKFVSKEKTG